MKSPPSRKATAGTLTKVTAETMVAIMLAVTAYHGSPRPPRKKSSRFVCLPASTTPSTVTSAR